MKIRKFTCWLLALLMMPIVSCGIADAANEPVKYDPPIEITMVRSSIGSSFSFGGENIDYENNVWTQELLERYGIIAKYLWITDASQYGTRWNLMAASGDIPDTLLANKNELATLMQDDLLMDLTDLYANAPERVRKYTQDIAPISFANASRDGRLYGIPVVPNGNEAQQVIFLRRDWLNNLGLEEPQTMQDLIEVATAFALNDPDGNGVNDTVGLPMRDAIYKDLDQTGFFNSFGAYPEFYLERDGQLVYGTIQPEMKDALLALQELYAKGVIDPEFGTRIATDMQSMIADSRLGIYYHYYWGGLHIANSVINDENADWMVMPIPSMTDQPAKVQSKISDSQYIVINKDCQNPEAVLAMADMFAEYFLEATSDEDFSRFINDATGAEIWGACAPTPKLDYADRSVTIHKQIVAALEGELAEQDMLAESRSVLQRVKGYLGGDKALYGWNVIYNDYGPLYWNDYYNQNDLTIYNQFIGAATKSQMNKGATLDKILQQAYTEIIKGADISAFDSAVEQWLSAGGQDVLNEVNAWYAGVK